jgi:uncharacterized Zn finger protein
MEFKEEMYGEDAGDQISQALHQTVKKLVSRRIDDMDIECQSCGSEELSPEAENPDEGEVRGYCKCTECGERKNIDIDYGDLNSVPTS